MLRIGDALSSWQDAGFAVDRASVAVGGVTIELIGDEGGRGILGWELEDFADDIDGLRTISSGRTEAPSGASHPNGVSGIDHVVIGTDDHERTVRAFGAHGIDPRRTTTARTPTGVRQQSFFWIGDVILELMGPVSGRHGDEGSSFWGLAFTSEELDATASALGDRLGPVKAAVQPGRRIATLRTRELGISVPIAIMSPHVRAAG